MKKTMGDLFGPTVSLRLVDAETGAAMTKATAEQFQVELRPVLMDPQGAECADYLHYTKAKLIEVPKDEASTPGEALWVFEQVGLSRACQSRVYHVEGLNMGGCT